MGDIVRVEVTEEDREIQGRRLRIWDYYSLEIESVEVLSRRIKGKDT
jgi:hypothetical protein